MSDLLSTSALAKLHGLSSQELFESLSRASLISRVSETWELLPAGVAAGGQYKDSNRFGRYILWPSDIELDSIISSDNINEEFLTSTKIGKNFDLSANRINSVLSELGWIQKSLKGWVVSDRGSTVGAEQRESSRSGIPYVVWPKRILENQTLSYTINELRGDVVGGMAMDSPSDDKQSNFREKFEARHRSTDGHYVRSKAEMLIDNWLYMAEIVHAYERKLPVEEDVYCDFYIPTGKVYIEYWGLENDPRYLKRKEAKREVYEKYGFKLIELNDSDVQNLDDVMPRLLLKYGIQSY